MESNKLQLKFIYIVFIVGTDIYTTYCICGKLYDALLQIWIIIKMMHSYRLIKINFYTQRNVDFTVNKVYE